MSPPDPWGESMDPDGVGRLASPDEPRWRPVRSLPARIVRGVVALSLVAAVLALVLTLAGFAWSTLAATIGVGLLYLFIAYQVRPEPDYDNLGWMGGVFNDPFRYTDDVNRFLALLMLVLWPGCFVVESLLELWRPRRVPEPPED